MQFVVDVRMTDAGRAAQYLPAHRDYLVENFKAGRFLMFGAYTDGTGGMLIAQASSKDALEDLLADDPLRAGNCATWLVTEFATAMAAPELCKLVDRQEAIR